VAETSEHTSVRDLLDRARAEEHADPVAARALIQQARTVAHAMGDGAGESEALYRLASLSFYAGRADEAFALAVEARDLAMDHGHYLVVAWSLNLLGIVHLGAGNYSEALQSCLQSVERYRMTDHRVDEGNHLNTVASVYHALGDTDRAIVTLEAALAANRELDRPDVDAITLANMASLRAERQEFLLAVSLGEQALQIAREHASSFIPQILTTLGEAYLGIGYPERAIEVLSGALEELRRRDGDGDSSNASVWTAALLALGQAAARSGDGAAAVAHLDRGLELACRNGLRSSELALHSALAEVHKSLGNYEAAVAHLEARFDVNQTLFNEGTDLRIRTLQIAHDTEQARQQAEILRLRTTELQQLVDGRTSAIEEFQLQLLERVVGWGADDPVQRRALDRAVGDLAARLALELQLSPAWSELLRTAARLRDVGEVGAARHAGADHALMGADLLKDSSSPMLQLAADVARGHHERWDGSGGPAQLVGSEIPLAARIVAVAEAWCSLCPDGTSHALQELQLRSGTWYDPAIVEALLRVIDQGLPDAVSALCRLGS
jgi:putative two-component system response regulator